jgi:hypothetical protein
MAVLNPSLEVLVTTRRLQANEWLSEGHELVAIEGIAEPDRFPGEGQDWRLPQEERTGLPFVRKRVAYVFLRKAAAP